MHCKISDCLNCPYPDCINDYVPKELTPEQREKKHIRDREWRKKKRAECIEKSICTKCHKQPVADGQRTCIYCRIKDKSYQRKRSEVEGRVPRWQMDGITYCRICGKSPLKAGYTICERCYNSATENLNAYRRSGGMSSYERRMKQKHD